eukprot:gene1437-2058_t
MAFLREQRMGWFPVEARVAEQMPQPPALEEEIAAWNNNPWNVRNDANNLNDTRRGGLHDGRWQDRANWAERKPPHMWCEGDRHEGRWQEQARVGDGGKGTDGVFDAAAALDDEKRRIHSGRWQARANFDDLTEDRRAGKNVRPPHNGKERRAYWEAGGFQKGACGMHEGRWEDGVWAVIREGSHELEPQWQHGRRPIGPELEDKRNAGGWEARGQVPYENEHPKPEKDRNFGRWEARAEWAEADTVVQRHREAPELHRGRWEERAFRDQPCTPQERAARKAAEARSSANFAFPFEIPEEGLSSVNTSQTQGPWEGMPATWNYRLTTLPVSPRLLKLHARAAGARQIPGRRRASRGDLHGGATPLLNVTAVGGAFSKWMEKGDKQWTRTPEGGTLLPFAQLGLTVGLNELPELPELPELLAPESAAARWAGTLVRRILIRGLKAVVLTQSSKDSSALKITGARFRMISKPVCNTIPSNGLTDNGYTLF